MQDPLFVFLELIAYDGPADMYKKLENFQTSIIPTRDLEICYSYLDEDI